MTKTFKGHRTMKRIAVLIAALAISLSAQAGVFTPSISAGFCPGDQATTSTSASLSIPSGPTQALLTPSVDTYIRFGFGSATAVVGAANNVLLKAGAIYVLGIPNGNSVALAFISASSGSMNVCYGGGE